MADLSPTLAAAAADGGVMVGLLIILATAAVVSLVFRRLKIATIPGYLIAGAIFGPNAVGLVQDSASVDAISHVAIVLLMFGIGMHLDRRDLRSGFVPILAVGMISTLLTAMFGTPIAMLFGLTPTAAAAVAIAMSMSSTAVVLRILQQRRELRQLHGRISFGTLLSQDLAVVAAIAFMPVLARLAESGVQLEEGAEPTSVLRIIASALVSIGAVGLMIIVGNYALPKVLAEAAKDTSHELLLVCSAAIGLGAAVLTGALGLSPELGAFLAGFLLAGTPFKHQLSGQIGPMRDLFMAVFFTAVGLGLDLGVMIELWWVVLLGVFAVMSLKSLTIGITAWVLGAPPIVAGVVAVSLAQAGEFSLVIAGVADANGLFGEQADRVMAILIGIVFISLLVTPSMISRAKFIAGFTVGFPRSPLRRGVVISQDSQTESEADTRKRVVVAGFGPVGRVVADKLAQAGCRITIVEINPETVRKQSSIGRRVIFGDITNEEVLHSADISEADAVLLTMPDDEAVLRATKHIRELNTTAYIAARTHYLSGAFLAKEVGANIVTVEEMATANTMADQVQQLLESMDGEPDDEPVSQASS
ncbi:MAG: cation:proton antiporter [Phycisphaerales bacterium JB061]